MIEVKYHQRRHELSATGHAGYAEQGQDIVCAAVSALMLTAAEFAKNNGDSSEIRTEPGDMYVRCLCLPRYDAPVTLVFNALAAGLYMTAQEHPENVKFERYA